MLVSVWQLMAKKKNQSRKPFIWLTSHLAEVLLWSQACAVLSMNLFREAHTKAAWGQAICHILNRHCTSYGGLGWTSLYWSWIGVYTLLQTNKKYLKMADRCSQFRKYLPQKVIAWSLIFFRSITICLFFIFTAFICSIHSNGWM